MNFLAHIILSGSSEEIILGNFIADAVKGNHYDTFPPDVIKGILLHRKIDHFTDSHPVFNATRARLRTEYGKYAGVIADIFYDHFLALDWKKYYDIPLEEYAAYIYSVITRHSELLPPKVSKFLPYMISGNWLVSYSTIEGIRRVLEGMSRRTKFDSGMHRAVHDLLRDYDKYREEFHAFFPQVQEFAQATLRTL